MNGNSIEANCRKHPAAVRSSDWPKKRITGEQNTPEKVVYGAGYKKGRPDVTQKTTFGDRIRVKKRGIKPDTKLIRVQVRHVRREDIDIEGSATRDC